MCAIKGVVRSVWDLRGESGHCLSHNKAIEWAAGALRGSSGKVPDGAFRPLLPMIFDGRWGGLALAGVDADAAQG